MQQRHQRQNEDKSKQHV
jgi:hypothetical protein